VRSELDCPPEEMNRLPLFLPLPVLRQAPLLGDKADGQPLEGRRRQMGFERDVAATGPRGLTKGRPSLGDGHASVLVHERQLGLGSLEVATRAEQLASLELVRIALEQPDLCGGGAARLHRRDAITALEDVVPVRRRPATLIRQGEGVVGLPPIGHEPDLTPERTLGCIPVCPRLDLAPAALLVVAALRVEALVLGKPAQLGEDDTEVVVDVSELLVFFERVDQRPLGLLQPDSAVLRRPQTEPDRRQRLSERLGCLPTNRAPESKVAEHAAGELLDHVWRNFEAAVDGRGGEMTLDAPRLQLSLLCQLRGKDE
jgi:hypothetical protein